MSNRAALSLLLSPMAIVAVVGGVVAAPGLADPLPYGPDTCIQGYVWRAGGPGDVVCVTPTVRDSTAEENQLAGQRREPNGGPYGPDTCRQGYVWREAFGGDHVCVTPASRTQAANDDAAATSRRAANAPAPPAPAQCLPNPLPGFISSGGQFC